MGSGSAIIAEKSNLIGVICEFHERKHEKPPERMTDKECSSNGKILWFLFGRVAVHFTLGFDQTVPIRGVTRMALELTHREMELVFSMLHDVDGFLEKQQRADMERKSDEKLCRLQKLVAANLRVKLNDELKVH